VLVALLRGRPGQRVVFLTTPPLLAFLGLLGRKLHGQRYSVWSMDLHPDAEIASGMLRERSLLGRLLRRLNESGYRAADFIVDLGPYMKRRITNMGVPAERTATVHVWSSKEELEPTPRETNPLVDELGLREKFVVMYSGNAGIVHDFRDILEAMRRLKDDPRIFFLFVGGGPQRASIERYAAEQGITNFRYLDYFPREKLRWSLPLGDAHFISLREPFVGISVPGKLYGIMGVGRPALFVGPARCESADTVRDADCGMIVDPEQGEAATRIVETLRRWSAAPEEARALGARGRAGFLARYEREPNCDAFAAIIDRFWPPVTPSRPASLGETPATRQL
jgi:colanic acid biosynthesis glycosyl transferase WcaI